MTGISVFLVLLTAREVGLSTEGVRAVGSPAPRCGHSGGRCAFVCADDQTGAIPGVKNGAPAVVLNWR